MMIKSVQEKTGPWNGESRTLETIETVFAMEKRVNNSSFILLAKEF